jgi:ABC-2 type transport system permease protein
MKLLSVYRVSLREQFRSPWDLALVFVLIPGMLFMYWFMASGGSTSYAVLVVNHDVGACPVGDTTQPCAGQAIKRMKELSYESGNPMLRVSTLGSRAEAEQKLRDRDAAALVIFPANFSESIRAVQQNVPESNVPITLVGDLNNSYYSVAAIASSTALDGYIREATGQSGPFQLIEDFLGGSSTRTEFEMYVPGLLIAAGSLMLYSIAIAITRQIESGTVRRLQITRMTSLDFLGGISLLYTLIAVISLLLAFVTAQALGFRSQGPLWVAVVICALTSFSVIGVGLITACLSGTTAKAAIAANFPLLLLLFFSGAVFPMAKIDLFTLCGHTFRLFDIIPQTHAVLALNKVLSLGAGLGDVALELIALVVLSALYFAIGVWLFQRTHLKAA